MPRPGPSVTSGADLQPGSDSLFPSGFTGGGARPSAGSVGTGEIADGSVAAADLNLASVTAALNGTYAKLSRSFRRTRLGIPPQETVIQTFAAGHGWGVSGSWASSNLNDTSDTGWAQQVITGTTPASNGTGVSFAKTFITATDVTNKIFKVLIKVDQPTNVNSVIFYAGDNTFANAISMNAVSGTGPTLLPGVWTTMTFSQAQATVTGTPVLSGVTAFKVRVADTGTALTVSLGGISMYAKHATFPNGVVTLCFDDGWSSANTLVREALGKYRFPATLFPIQDQIGTAGHMTKAQLDDLVSSCGWEVGGHASTLASHEARFTSLSTGALQAEFDAIRYWLIDNGYTDLIAYPYGAYNASVINESKLRFAAARSTDGGIIETPYPGEPSRLRSFVLAPGTADATLSGLVDAAYTNGNHLVLTMHDVVSSGASGASTINLATLTTLLAYINTKGIPVRRMSDVLAA